MRTCTSAVITTLGIVVAAAPAGAATITESYTNGHPDVLINGYGAPAMGTFELTDGTAVMQALCVEAHVSHSTAPDGYRQQPNQVDSAELDYLLWRYLSPGSPAVDADTAVALAALAWFYAGATRDIGVPVWADGTRGFAPISPVDPVAWDALPAMTLASPAGLRSGATDLDGAERLVLELHLEAQTRRGPWELSPIRLDGRGTTVAVTARGEPIAGAGVHFTVTGAAGEPITDALVSTDASGRAVLPIPDLPSGGAVAAAVSSPGGHAEWDGDGALQRLVTAAPAELVARLTIEASPPPTTMPPTTVPLATTTSTTIPPATTTSTTSTTAPPDTTTTTSTTTSTTSTTSTSTTSTSTTTAPTTVAPTTTVGSTTTSTTPTVPAAPPDTEVSPPAPPSLPTTGGGRAQLVIGLAGIVTGAGGLLWSLVELTRARMRTPPKNG